MVDVRNNFFSPTEAVVDAGSTVTWTWQVNADHNVVFQDGQQSSDTKSSGTHQRGFPNTGTFRYRCTLHSADFSSGMSGSVVVE